jgi:hypothetical protein
VNGDEERKAARFQAVGDRQRSDGKRVRHNRGAGRIANRTEMRRRPGSQIGAEMELRAQEDDREEQSQDANSTSVFVHVVNKMELKEEWLRGQVIPWGKARVRQ